MLSRRHLTWPALTAFAALAVAGCGAAAEAGTTHPAAATAASKTVSVKSFPGAGKVLVDSHGRPLYTPSQESTGKVLCKGQCVHIWAPLSAKHPTAASGVGKLATIKRPDGIRQVTVRGKHAYTFVLDPRGKVTGDGIKDSFAGVHFTWHVLRPAGA